MDTKNKKVKKITIQIPPKFKQEAEKQLRNFLGLNGVEGTYLYHKKKKHGEEVTGEDFEQIDAQFLADLLEFTFSFAMHCMVNEKVKEVKNED